jgi:hypothetical protein
MTRPALNKVQSHWRINPSTAQLIIRIALKLGYVYAPESESPRAKVGEFMDDLVEGKVSLDNLLTAVEQIKAEAKQRA